MDHVILLYIEIILQIGIQLAVLIAKIARHDCPRQWQELIPTLLVAIRCDDPLLQQRALLTMYHVIKTLASKRLANDRKLFEEVNRLVGLKIEIESD